MRGDFSVEGYEVEGLLGAGASGESWLARSLSTRQQVALRRVPAGSSDTHEKARRLVGLLGELAHPHLLGVQDLLAQEDEVVFVQDHADGGSLAQLLMARGTLDPGEVVTTVAPVAEAAHAVHQRQAVHGDITPEHICYTGDGLPLLDDVGVLALNEVDPGQAGTHGYTDPLAPGDAALTPAADVYSLAAVCYAMLTGDPPPPPHERRPLHELAPGVPSALAHAVEAGLQGDPARRPTAGQFAELLYGATQPAPVRFPLGLVITGSDPTSGTDPFGQQSSSPAGPPTGSTASSTAPPTSAESRGGTDQTPPVLGGGTGATTWQPSDDDEEPEPRGRRWLIVAAIVAPVIVAIAVVGGLALLNDGSDGPGPTPNGGPTPTNDPNGNGNGQQVELETIPPNPPDDPEQRRWWDVLTELDDRRGAAFAQADPNLLSDVYTEDAVVLRGDDPNVNDRRKIDQFRQVGARAEGVRFHIEEIAVNGQPSEGEVVLDVTDVLQEHAVIDGSGERQVVPAGEPTGRTITLRQEQGEWRIYNIEPSSAG